VLIDKPGFDQVPADPSTPGALEGHAAPHGGHGEPDAQGRKDRQKVGLVPDLAAVAKLERIEKVSVP
jgi:hypothetical protein